MEIKYAGPKPVISHKCVNFDSGKEDKYIYIQAAIELYKALDHEYFEDKTYTFKVTDSVFTDEEMAYELKNICHDLEELERRHLKHMEEDYNSHIDRACENEILSQEEKDVLTNNLNIMHDYMVQRSINKAAYYCLVDALAEILKNDHIDYIVVPMNPRYVHVLHSVQGSLMRQKFPIDTSLDIYKHEEELQVKLKVMNK